MFLYKCSSRTKHNVTFWLMLFSWMFISSYTTIYFFAKKFIFLNVYISVNTIFECLYMFFRWERGHQLSTHATGGGQWGSCKMHTAAYRGRECHTSCVLPHLLYLISCFWQHFSLIVSYFICRNLTLPLFKKNLFVRKGYFSPTRSISVIIKYAFLTKIIFANQN